MRQVLTTAVACIALIATAHAHDGALDAADGHFHEGVGWYHFHNEPNVEEEPAHHYIGPWIYTVVPALDGAVSGDAQGVTSDAMAVYTDGEIPEISIAKSGVEPGVQKGNGWRLDWEVGFLKEDNPVCAHNIPEIAGHLASLHGSSWFYGVFMFKADRAARATLHIHYTATARVWLNGTEIYRTMESWGGVLIEDDSPFLPQAQIRQGNNLLVVRIGRGWNNCGNAPMWFLWCGFMPHTPTRIEVPLIYERGAVNVNHVTSWAELKTR